MYTVVVRFDNLILTFIDNYIDRGSTFSLLSFYWRVKQYIWFLVSP